MRRHRLLGGALTVGFALGRSERCVIRRRAHLIIEFQLRIDRPSPFISVFDGQLAEVGTLATSRARALKRDLPVVRIETLLFEDLVLSNLRNCNEPTHRAVN